MIEPTKLNDNENEDMIMSKRKEIDIYFDRNEYCKAFGLLVNFLEGQNPVVKMKILSYYEGRIYSVSSCENNSFSMGPYNNLR